jgi:tRNA (adenine22-N1)-methyltransferase
VGARLPPRLRPLAASVPPGAAVADIGCGDAQLALALRALGHRVVASERLPGPAARARARLGECRVGEGLEPLVPGEVDVAIIAGLGGRTIASILERSPEVVRSLSLLLLQPMQREGQLREWLHLNRFEVSGEMAAADRGRSYTVLVVRPPR